LERHNEVAQRTIARFRGRAIKSTGDGVLATFDGSARAIRCAFAMRDVATVGGARRCRQRHTPCGHSRPTCSGLRLRSAHRVVVRHPRAPPWRGGGAARAGHGQRPQACSPAPHCRAIDPEICLSALRLRALDMAIGNLLGSNLFNVTILAIDDVFNTPGPLLADASPVHAGTAVAAVIMSGLVMIGLVMRPQGRVLRVVSWVSVGLLATYVLNAALVFLHGT